MTAREREVLLLVACGLTATKIAVLLCISPVTAHCHQSHILDRLDAHSMAHAVAIAFARGIVTREELAEAIEKRSAA